MGRMGNMRYIKIREANVKTEKMTRDLKNSIKVIVKNFFFLLLHFFISRGKSLNTFRLRGDKAKTATFECCALD